MGTGSIATDRTRFIHWSIAFGVVAIGLVAGSLYLRPRDHGPYACADCALGMPQPDEATRTLLTELAPGIATRWTRRNHTYIVCNDSACGYYRITDSDDFHGDRVVKQASTPPDGGPSSN